jgi:glutaredoxin
MKKIKVVLLSGCGWCAHLKDILIANNISFETIDADKEGALADQLEDLLNTTYYPIVIVETDTTSSYFYRAVDIAGVGITSLGSKVEKIGCVDIETMVTQILNK